QCRGRMSHETRSRKDRLIAILVGVPLLALILTLVGGIAWANLWPVSFIRTFNLVGKLNAVAPIPDGQLAIFELVSRRGGKGPTFSANRLQTIDATTGKVVGGPWVMP